MEELFEFLPTDDLQNEEIALRLRKATQAVPEKGWMPAYHFDICLPDGTRIGECCLRMGNTEALYYAGNIGYEVDAPYRGNHYAAKACALLLRQAKKHGMEYLITTCDPGNAASSKTCQYAGGRLLEIADIPAWHDMYKEGKRQVMVYRFDLGDGE